MTVTKAKMINIEITSRCSARCLVCPHDTLYRKNRDMSFEDIMSIVGDAYNIGIRHIHPHLFGEPTMHPQYTDILYGIKNKYKDIEIVQYTNGYGLYKDEIVQAILDTIDRLVISVDGASADTMKKTRPGLDHIKITNGIKKLYQNRSKKRERKPYIIIRMTKMPENIEDVDKYKYVWKPYSDKTVIVYLQNFHGFIASSSKIRSNLPCDRIFHAVAVTVDNNVVLCCDDYKEESIIGNLNKESLKDIWYGKKMEYIRKLHMERNLSSLPICSKCTYLGHL